MRNFTLRPMFAAACSQGAHSPTRADAPSNAERIRVAKALSRDAVIAADPHRETVVRLNIWLRTYPGLLALALNAGSQSATARPMPIPCLPSSNSLRHPQADVGFDIDKSKLLPREHV